MHGSKVIAKAGKNRCRRTRERALLLPPRASNRALSKRRSISHAVTITPIDELDVRRRRPRVLAHNHTLIGPPSPRSYARPSADTPATLCVHIDDILTVD